MRRAIGLTNALFAAAVALGTLAGCDKHTDSGATVGEKVDKAIDSAGQAARAGEKAAKEAAQSIEKAGERVGDVMADSAITAAIKAELIKDPAVSAFNIDVNTVNGEVTLRGNVANEAAREGAERIASGAKGSVKVNNLLQVTPNA